jgi:hypothetical protein
MSFLKLLKTPPAREIGAQELRINRIKNSLLNKGEVEQLKKMHSTISKSAHPSVWVNGFNALSEIKDAYAGRNEQMASASKSLLKKLRSDYLKKFG